MDVHDFKGISSVVKEPTHMISLALVLLVTGFLQDYLGLNLLYGVAGGLLLVAVPWQAWRMIKGEAKLQDRPASPEAKFCPACDTRMEPADTKRFDVWWYRCPKCEKLFQYPAPTASK